MTKKTKKRLAAVLASLLVITSACSYSQNKTQNSNSNRQDTITEQKGLRKELDILGVEIPEQEYELIKTDYKINDDDTHTIIKTYQLGEEIKTEQDIKSHSYTTWKEIDETTEALTCICGKELLKTTEISEEKQEENTLDTLNITEETNNNTLKENKTPEEIIETIKPEFKLDKVSYEYNNNETHIVTKTYKNEETNETKVETTVEKCNLTDWKTNGNNQMITECLTCGHKITKSIETEHNFIKIKEEVVSNNDGTHNIITTYVCPRDNEMKTETKTVKCSYTHKGNMSECIKCAYRTKKTYDYNYNNDHNDYNDYNDNNNNDNIESHIHNFIKVSEEIISNNNDTHSIITTYKCTSDNETKTTTEIKDCIFGEWILSEDKKTLTSKCQFCDNTKTKQNEEAHEHEYVKDSEKYVSNNNGTHTLITTYKCTSDDDIKTESEIKDCKFGEWVLSEDKKTLTSTCQNCGYTISKQNIVEHIHNYVKINEKITYNNNDTHTKTITYRCQADGDTKVNSSTESCSFGSIVLENVEGVLKEYKICSKCNGKKYIRDHVHSNPPIDLQYNIIGGNGDNTHSLKGTYNCTICNEEIEDIKNEPCDNTTTGYEIFSEYNSYNEHDRIGTCNTCGYENKIREACTKIGEMKYIKIGPYTYEYYNCEFCNGYVDRFEHTTHTFGEWEMNDDYHIRYCGCVEAREEGEHQYTYEEDPDNSYNQKATCDICGYTKNVLNHTHLPHGMGLMDLIETDEYKSGNVSRSQVPNPNPAPDAYCSAYEVICPTCNTKYLIEYNHSFVNGVCTRKGYCGGMIDPNYVPELPSDEILDDNNINSDTYLENDYPEEEITRKLTINS